MRLTLRTLLAYVDDILDPEDAQDIARKIEESEFATELLERRRDVLRKLRLSAPDPQGGPDGLDPNTVSEYLDNTLPPEHVADVERVCLESDIHLAEVSACHQVLTLVLGSPADVEPGCRRRLYDLGAGSPSTRTNPPRATPEATTFGGERPTASELPEYLQTKRRMPGWLVLASLGAVGGGLWWTSPESLRAAWAWGRARIVALQAPGKAERRDTPSPPAQIAADSAPSDPLPTPAFGGETPVPGYRPEEVGTPADGEYLQAGAGPSQAAMRTAGDPPVDAPEESVGPSLRDLATSPEVAEAGAVDPFSGSVAGAPAETSPAGETSDDGAWAPMSPAEAEVGRAESSPEPEPGAAEGSEASLPLVVARGEGAEPESTEPALAWPGQPRPAAVEQAPAAPEPSANPVAGQSPATDDEASDAGDSPTIATTLAPAAPTENHPQAHRDEAVIPATYSPANLASETATLWRLDPSEGVWRPLTSGETLSAGNRLASWSLERPQIDLGGGLSAELVGGARASLSAPPAMGPPTLTLEQGRAVLRFASPAYQPCGLQVGPHELSITSSGAAVVAIDPRCSAVDGRAKPEDLGCSVEIHLVEGAVTIHLGDALDDVTAPAIVRIPAEGVPEIEVNTRTPAWVLAPPGGGTEQRLATELRSRLGSGGHSSESLRAFAASKQRELRHAAITALAAIDEFGPAAAILNDPAEKAFWATAAELLQAGIARGPEASDRVRTALRQSYATSTADELHRLLCGVTNKELAGGLSRQLAADLNHDELAVRVVAFWNLRQLSKATYGYQPEQTAAKRRPATQRWQKELEAGRVAGRPTAGRS